MNFEFWRLTHVFCFVKSNLTQPETLANLACKLSQSPW